MNWKYIFLLLCMLTSTQNIKIFLLFFYGYRINTNMFTDSQEDNAIQTVNIVFSPVLINLAPSIPHPMPTGKF